MIAVSVAMLAMAACSKDEPRNYRGDRPLEFSSTILGDTQTRAQDNYWNTGDNIGVYMMSQAGGTIAQHATHHNIRHTTVAADGKFVASVPAEAIYLREDSAPVSFVGYYPWTDAITAGHEYPVDLSDQTDITKIDLLHAKLDSHNVGNTTPKLTFSHKLAKVVFNIRDLRAAPQSLQGLTVTVKGMDTKALFSLDAGSIVSSSTPGDIPAKIAVTGTTATARALVIPKNAVTYSIEVTLPGDEESSIFTFNDRIYQPGERHNYIVNITDGDADPELILIDGEGSISPWNDIDEDEPIVIDKGDGEDDDDPVVDPTISASSPAQVAAAGGPVAVACTVTGTGTLSVGTALPSWLSAAVSGNSVNFTVSANTATTPRSQTVTLNYGTASTTVTISQAGAIDTPPADETTVNFDFTALAATETIPNASPSGPNLPAFTYQNVTLTPSQGSHQSTAPRWWDNGMTAALRTYAGNTMTFTAPTGKNIVKMEFTNSADTGARTEGFTASTGTLSGLASWTGSAGSVTLTINLTAVGVTGNPQHWFEAIKVTYK